VEDQNAGEAEGLLFTPRTGPKRVKKSAGRGKQNRGQGEKQMGSVKRGLHTRPNKQREMGISQVQEASQNRKQKGT